MLENLWLASKHPDNRDFLILKPFTTFKNELWDYKVKITKINLQR